MRIFKLLILGLIIWSAPALADPPEAYVVEDGPTSNVESDDITAGAPAPKAAKAVEQRDIGQPVYDPVSRKPPCENSTCITPQTIANADHAYVEKTNVKTYLDLIDLPEPTEDENGEEQEAECSLPVKTDIIVYRQVVEEGSGIIVQHNDAFCINQGCVYFGGNGNEKCELPSEESE
jgi:hypothetical protein